MPDLQSGMGPFHSSTASQVGHGRQLDGYPVGGLLVLITSSVAGVLSATTKKKSFCILERRIHQNTDITTMAPELRSRKAPGTDGLLGIAPQTRIVR